MSSTRSFLHAALSCLALSWQITPLYTILRAGTQIALSSMSVVTVYCTKLLVDQLGATVVSPAVRWSAVLWLIIGMGLLQVLRMVMGKVSEYASMMQQDKLRGNMNAEFMSHMMGVDMQFFDSPSYQDMVQAWYRDSYAVNNMIWNLISLGGAAVTVVAAWGLLFEANIWYALITSLSVIPAAISDRKYTRALYYWGLDHIADERKMGYVQGLASARRQAGEVRLYGLKDVLLQKYQDIWQRYFGNKKGTVKRKTVLAALFYLLPEICASTIIIMLAWRIVGGDGGAGDYVLYSGMLWQLIGGLQMAIRSVMSVYEDKLRVEIIDKFRNIKNDVADDGEMELDKIHSVTFEEVSFRYPHTPKDILHDLSFAIREQEKICLVGVNGSGKSTIIKLLLRFYDVSSGTILINGTDIREYTIRSLRKGFSTYFQEFENYAFSVRDNVSLSDVDGKEPDDREILRVLHQAGKAEWLEGSSLESYVTKSFDEEGIELSGGQHQQLALARAIWRPCEMIVFDEPTGALDPETELRFFENVEKLWQGKAALFTSHRLSAAHLADRIFVLENGRIIENGTHGELMRLHGRYHRLFTMQAEKYIAGSEEGVR